MVIVSSSILMVFINNNITKKELKLNILGDDPHPFMGLILVKEYSHVV